MVFKLTKHYQRQIYLFILETCKIYVHSADPADFSNVSVNMLESSFTVQEENFQKFSPDSLVILDDFQLRTKQEKLDFLRVINVTLRHQKITLILIIHNLFGNNLFNDIMFAPHLFLSCSNIGFSILSKMYLRLGGSNVLNFYQNEPKVNFQFLYINCQKHYLINNVQQLFDRSPKNVKMFTNQQKFVIHLADYPCGTSESKTEPTIASDVNDLVLTLYPKQKSLQLVTKQLLKNNALDEDLCFVDEKKVHLADFLRFLNNTFDKNNKPNVHISKLCKILASQSIRFPSLCVKNPIAKRFFC